LQETVAVEFGFKLTHHSMRILGLCDECQKKDAETSASGAQPRIRVKSVFS